jgi:hypothetical protein
MYKLLNVYQEIQDSIRYFLKLFRLGKKEGITPEQIMKLIQMADSIHKLQEKLEQLQSEVLDISIRKSVGKEELEDLLNEKEAVQERLNSVDKACKMKYEDLTEICLQIRKVENYLEKLKNGQDYKELEAIVRSEVGKTILDNKKLLQNALFSVLLALRNDPDRYFIIDRMDLTSFTTNTILNYNLFLSSRRPSYLQGNEQFISGRVSEMADKILCNLQKGIVDSTISTAAGL